MDYKEKIKALPAGPGVYIMKNSSGIVLYVGKAGNIRKRVSSYFRPSTKTNPRKESLVDKIADISFISTMTEAEALIYENGLIKRFSPKYNVALKDGKSYPFLKLTTNEDFPRLFMTRRNAEVGASYYGPYADAGLLRLALMELRQMFPLRSCNKMTKRVCLNYYILQCPGPCEAKIDKNSYWETVSELKLFLEAKRPELIKSLSDKMREAASK
jgi:excinuclease ABC subunit C